MGSTGEPSKLPRALMPPPPSSFAAPPPLDLLVWPEASCCACCGPAAAICLSIELATGPVSSTSLLNRLWGSCSKVDGLSNSLTCRQHRREANRLNRLVGLDLRCHTTSAVPSRLVRADAVTAFPLQHTRTWPCAMARILSLKMIVSRRCAMVSVARSANTRRMVRCNSKQTVKKPHGLLHGSIAPISRPGPALNQEQNRPQSCMHKSKVPQLNKSAT